MKSHRKRGKKPWGNPSELGATMVSLLSSVVVVMGPVVFISLAFVAFVAFSKAVAVWFAWLKPLFEA